MARTQAIAERLTDLATYGLSLVLAAGVLAFAAYKVAALNGMENPPANLGLNFPPPKRKVIMENGAAGAGLTTQSLAPAADAPRRLADEAGLRDYDLLTVIDGVAFVAVNGDEGRNLVPVTVGSRLPGGLTVSALQRRAGRWSLVAGNLTLEQRLPSRPEMAGQ